MNRAQFHENLGRRPVAMTTEAGAALMSAHRIHRLFLRNRERERLRCERSSATKIYGAPLKFRFNIYAVSLLLPRVFAASFPSPFFYSFFFFVTRFWWDLTHKRRAVDGRPGGKGLHLIDFDLFGVDWRVGGCYFPWWAASVGRTVVMATVRPTPVFRRRRRRRYWFAADAPSLVEDLQSAKIENDDLVFWFFIGLDRFCAGYFHCMFFFY